MNRLNVKENSFNESIERERKFSERELRFKRELETALKMINDFQTNCLLMSIQKQLSVIAFGMPTTISLLKQIKDTRKSLAKANSELSMLKSELEYDLKNYYGEYGEKEKMKEIDIINMIADVNRIEEKNLCGPFCCFELTFEDDSGKHTIRYEDTFEESKSALIHQLNKILEYPQNYSAVAFSVKERDYFNVESPAIILDIDS